MTQQDSNLINIAQLAFHSIIPVKFTGINSHLPFHTIISQSQLLYFTGRSLILQNIKTSQQKIIWTNHYQHSPEAIEHIKNAFQSHVLGIACRDGQGNHFVVILEINSMINSYERFSDKEREKDKMHYLKGLGEDDMVEKLRFFQEGGLFVVVTRGGSQEGGTLGQNKNVSVYSINNGDKLYSTSFISRNPIVETLRLNRESFICIMRNQPEQQKQSSQQHSLPLSSGKKNKHSTSSNFTINLLSENSLSIGNQICIELQQEEYVLEVNFVENNHKMMSFMLLNTGFVLGFGVDERGFHQSVRMDVKVNKGEHSRRVYTRRQESEWRGDGITKAQHKKQVSFNSIHEDEQYYMPSCMSCSSNRVILGYNQFPFIGVLQYSGVDHHQYKFRYIDDFFPKQSQILSIHTINFSQDGCHCSVLVQMDTKYRSSFQNKIKAKSSIRTWRNEGDDDGELYGWEMGNLKDTRLDCMFGERKYFRLMLIDFVSGLIQHFYHNEAIQESLTCSSLNGVVRSVEFSLKNNTVFVLMTDGRLSFCAMNFSKVTQTQANSKNLSITPSKQPQQLQNPNLTINDSLPRQMLLWCEKKGHPYLTLCHPIAFQLILIYEDSIKFHFYNFQQLFDSHYILGLKNCKAASYSPLGDKLALGTLGSVWVVDSYTYVVIRKITLMSVPIEITSSKVALYNSNSQQQKSKMVKRANSMMGSLSAKTVSKIQYINNSDIIIQTGNTTLSILLNYQKILFFGYTSEPIAGHLFSYDSKHNLGVIASQNCLTVIKKSTINSKNRCEQLARIDIVVSSLLLCGEIDVLFIGGRNGVLSFVRWPDYFQSQSATKHPNLNNKLYLSHSPIVGIQMSINYKQLFVVAEQGMVVICDLIISEKLQKIGKDVSLHINKKVNYQLPLLNKWLVSMSDGEKRAEKFTKLMGNEAEIKINETTFPESFKLVLQKQLQDEKIRLDEELKSEIRRYEIEMGIQRLQLNIVLARDEVRSIVGKRESEGRELNDKIEIDLRKVFVEKGELEKRLEQVCAGNQAEKKALLQAQQQQYNLRFEANSHKTSQSQSLQLHQLTFYQQQAQSYIQSQQTMKQDFEDNLQQTQMFYGGEFRQIEDKNNLVGQENRNMKIRGLELSEKMREVDVRMEELEVDVGVVERERRLLAQVKQQLSLKIVSADIHYHELITKNKQIQMQLHKIRVSSERCQMRYNQLQKQIELLTTNLNNLAERSQQNSNDFVKQYNSRNAGIMQEEGLKKRIIKLKQRRKQVFDRNVLLKDTIRGYEKQLTTQTSDNHPNSYTHLADSLGFRRSHAHKLNYDIQKWSKVNADIKSSTIRQSVRMNQETSKLIFRYNELMRQHKQLVRVQNGLLRAIAMQRQTLILSMAHPFSTCEKFSFVPLINRDQHKKQQSVPKIRNCLSINTNNNRTFSKDSSKLNSTSSYFSPSNSAHEEISLRNTVSKLKGLAKVQQDNNNRLSKLSKTSIKKNMFQIKDEKAGIKQLAKIANTSLYHGVTLDPKTLKPNKMLCISLHKGGEEAKFVTEY